MIVMAVSTGVSHLYEFCVQQYSFCDFPDP